LLDLPELESETPSSSTCVALRRPWESLATSKMTTSPTLGFRVAFLTLEMWKKTCSLLPSGLMKPKPLSSFHETIFPFILVELSFLMAYLTPGLGADLLPRSGGKSVPAPKGRQQPFVSAVIYCDLQAQKYLRQTKH